MDVCLSEGASTAHIEGYIAHVRAFDKHGKMLIVAPADPFSSPPQSDEFLTDRDGALLQETTKLEIRNTCLFLSGC